MFSNTLQPLFFLLFFIFPIAQTADEPAYTAVDLILLDCGSSTNTTDSSGRSWGSDEHAPVIAAGLSIPSRASRVNPSGLSVPYDTARVFNSSFTYSFHVSIPGHKFLRLYFYPDTYSGLTTSQSFFAVTANGVVLLSNFSAFLHSDNPSFVKEFVVNVDGDQGINLTFSPNPNSFAFINGIEIVSLPDRLYFRNVPIRAVNDRLENLQNGTALETLYRLNVGGADVPIQDDSGMFRYWTKDDDYIFGSDFGYTPHEESHAINYTAETPPYTAPEIVYRTSRTMTNTSTSLEWGFPVDSGFRYLLRFHFCEIQLEVTKQEERIFTISINNETAEINADVIFWTRGTGIPVFRDYIAWIQDDGRRGKKDLRISLFPYADALPRYRNALLNGLEIFKLSDLNQSLAAANPDPLPPPTPASPSPAQGRRKTEKSTIIYAVVGGVVGVLTLLLAVNFIIFRRKGKNSSSITSKNNGLPSSLCRHFTLGEIMAATNNFDNSSIIGRGGFGNVYKGLIDNGATVVAVKRLKASSKQGPQEFLTEIALLSKLRHRHLVSLIGYCIENREMILIYEYMANGNLRDHLLNSGNSPLNWKQRLQICLGAAKGLHYLHTGLKEAIIHRDVKSTNILLDEQWIAKVSDFGLSKTVPTDGPNAHVSTAVKGSVGYIDPEYWRLQQLTDKSDVYSFGVVLFEVLCARPAVIHDSDRDKQNLAEWAKMCHRRGTVDQIIDSNLKGQIAPECLNKFLETAMMCLQDKRTERQAMKDVVWSLEFALQLQEAMEGGGGSSGNLVSPVPLPPPFLVEEKEAKTMDEETFSGTSETLMWSRSGDLPSVGSSEKLSFQEVFSKMKETSGR